MYNRYLFHPVSRNSKFDCLSLSGIGRDAFVFDSISCKYLLNLRKCKTKIKKKKLYVIRNNTSDHLTPEWHTIAIVCWDFPSPSPKSVLFQFTLQGKQYQVTMATRLHVAVAFSWKYSNLYRINARQQETVASVSETDRLGLCSSNHRS